MSTAERQFTTDRENELTAELDGLGITDNMERRRWETYEAYYHIRRARERDRDSRTRLILRYKPTDEFEHHGRHFVRLLELERQLRPLGVERGGALRAEPGVELRGKIALFKSIQAAREDAFESKWGCGVDDDPLGRDVSARLGLGGMQDFTASRENTHKRPKGYAPWKPQKKTARLMYQVRQILEEYRDHLPLTARQIFYRLLAAHGYPKTDAAYGRLTEHLTRARRAEMIPFEHIRDDGISVMEHAHYADENAFYRHVHNEGKAYKRDKLARQNVNVRVYCEAAGMMPQLEKVCEPYSIPVYSCSGFDSLSAKYQLKTACWQAYTYQGRQTIILHLGDHDPSGDSIFNDGLVEDIYAFLDKDVPHKEPHEVATFERVALRTEHIERFNLPTEPPKKSDSRTKNWQGGEVCQLEALPPDVLAGLLDATIRTYLNLAVYEQDLKAEENERRRITKALPAVGGAA